jgi:hypothetical protein
MFVKKPDGGPIGPKDVTGISMILCKKIIKYLWVTVAIYLIYTYRVYVCLIPEAVM